MRTFPLLGLFVGLAGCGPSATPLAAVEGTVNRVAQQSAGRITPSILVMSRGESAATCGKPPIAQSSVLSTFSGRNPRLLA